MIIKCVLLIIIVIYATIVNSWIESKEKLHSIKQDIIAEAPWRLKLILLNDNEPDFKINTLLNRRVNIEALTKSSNNITEFNLIKRKQSNAPNNTIDEHLAMRTEILRLMSLKVLDTNKKVKTAEIIREKYLSLSEHNFDVGFLKAELDDKYDILMRFSYTYNKLHGNWRPVENVIAYEQIVTHSMQINHLIDVFTSLLQSKKYNISAL